MCYLGLSPKLPLVTIWQRQCEFRQNVGDHKEQLRKEQSILFYFLRRHHRRIICLYVSQFRAGTHPLAHAIREEARLVLFQFSILQKVFRPELIRMTPQLGILGVQMKSELWLISSSCKPCDRPSGWPSPWCPARGWTPRGSRHTLSCAWGRWGRCLRTSWSPWGWPRCRGGAPSSPRSQHHLGLQSPDPNTWSLSSVTS